MDAQVEIHHHGVYLFKGLTEPSAVIQMSRRKWAARKFPPPQSNRKAQLVGPGLGLLATIQLQS